MDDEDQGQLKEHYKAMSLRVLIGSAALIFVISTVFWAGATYNRVEGIESQLSKIGEKLDKLSTIDVVNERTLRDEQRITRLEEEHEKDKFK